MSWIAEQNDCLMLNIRVVPRAARDEIKGVMGDELKVRIQAPPVDGKANDRLTRFLSKRWKIPRANVEIHSGESGRSKRIRISNPPPGLSGMLRQLK